MTVAEPPGECKDLLRCRTGGIPATGVCRSYRSCTAAFTAGQNFTKDGRSKHPMYGLLKDMLHRCTTRSSYYRTGIQVYRPWMADPWLFYEFMDTEMPPRPLDEFVTVDGRRVRRYTLDRVDNDKDYEPGNLRWLDRAEQNRNRGHEAAAWERGWHDRVSCLCDPLWRESCACDAARCWQLLGRGPDERDEVEPWPPSADAGVAEAEHALGPAMVLGHIIGRVQQARDSSAVPVGQLDSVWFAEPQPLPSSADPDLDQLLCFSPRVDFADLLADGEGLTFDDLLEGNN